MDNKNFDDLKEKLTVEKPKPAKEYLEPYYQTLGDGTLEYLGVRTGLPMLDKKTLGLDGLIVLGGIAGSGKTSLALQIAYEACVRETPVIFYSLEMPKRAIFTKIFNRLARVGYSDILLKARQYLDKTRQDKNILNEDVDYYKLLKKDEVERLKEARDNLEKVGDKFYLRTRESKEADINFDNVRQEITLLKAVHNTDKVLVVIDHLQVFNVENYGDQIDKEGKLIKGFKGICEETGATILLLSQKNKAGFDNSGLKAIKGSVDIVYLADVVMFLETEKEKQNSSEEKVIVDFEEGNIKNILLLIAKNRYNAPCSIKLFFEGRFSSFVEDDGKATR